MKKRSLFYGTGVMLLSLLLFTGCEKENMTLPVDEFNDLELKTLIVTPPEDTTEYYTETAYANFLIEDGGYVFTGRRNANPDGYPSLDIGNKWGWAGNLGEGEHILKIYAGAGNNDLSKGTFIGRLLVKIYNGNQVYVKYLMYPGIYMQRVHIYISDVMPQTTAPGQYGFTQEFYPPAISFKDIFTVEDTNGDGMFWVIAHADVNIHLSADLD